MINLEKSQEIVNKNFEWISNFVEENNLSKEDKNQIRYKMYSACQEMAEWKERQMINKTCEWLRKNIMNYQNWEYNEFHQCVEYDDSVDIKKMISDFRKAMKE